jgi:acetyl-CoA carboxylase biotin carboxyl carrier protein
LSKKIPKKKQGKARASASGGGAMSGSPMDVRVLQQIVELMSANDLNTIEVRDGDKRVILKRGAAIESSHGTAGSYGAHPHYAPPAAQSPAMTSGAATTNGSAAPADDTAGMTPIKSPMVGTFYSSPSPDAKAFVQVGSTVDEETDVCIIEAMKVFNNIKAECRGTISKILVTNGQTVEFGQILFLVKPG